MTVPPAPDAIQAAEVYAATFAGRHDAYSIFMPPEPGADGHWQALRKPLTAETVLGAFTTRIPISGYFLSAQSTTHLAALDLDLENGYQLGQVFLAHVRKLGGIGYLEASRRGAHVWMVLSAIRPAITVRLALKALIAESGLPDDRKIELRPGSDRLGDALEGEEAPLGHCLRMPTMPHPKTGKRYVLVSSDGVQLGGRLTEFMAEVELCPVSVFDDAAERAPMPDVPLVPPRSLKNPYGEEKSAAYSESVCDILRDLWGVTETLIPGRGIHCPSPDHRDANKSAMVHRSDERLLCFSPACWMANNGSGRGTVELTLNAPGRRAG